MLPKIYKDLTWQEKRTVREQYVEHQQGLCYYCQRNLKASPIHDKEINWSLFPGREEFLRYPIHLHHCHTTGLTIGAVHSYCNAVLWQYHGE